MRASNAGRGGRGRRKAKRRQDQREENTEKKKKRQKARTSPPQKITPKEINPRRGKGGAARRGRCWPPRGGGRGKGEGRTDGWTDGRGAPTCGRAAAARTGRLVLYLPRPPAGREGGGSGRYAHNPPPALPAPSPPEGSRLSRPAPGLAHRPATGSYRGPARG